MRKSGWIFSAFLLDGILHSTPAMEFGVHHTCSAFNTAGIMGGYLGIGVHLWRTWGATKITLQGLGL